MPNVIPCINLCETAGYTETAEQIVEVMARTCHEAGFPGCERLYTGSYVCENYFLGLPDSFHEAIGSLCAAYDMGATLVVPIFGQAFLERGERRLADVLERFGDVYDEVVVNDVAQFFHVQAISGKRIGLGRLMMKEQRDVRYTDLVQRTAHPQLSAEARECIAAGAHRPLVEVDPISQIVDVSGLREGPGAEGGGEGSRAEASQAEALQTEIAIHLPYCLATTGRNCGPASALEEPDQKFRLGRGCSRHCLRLRQGCTTEDGVAFVKHGRAYYFANPTCQIAGIDRWRIVYAAASDMMR